MDTIDDLLIDIFRPKDASQCNFPVGSKTPLGESSVDIYSDSLPYISASTVSNSQSIDGKNDQRAFASVSSTAKKITELPIQTTREQETVNGAQTQISELEELKQRMLKLEEENKNLKTNMSLLRVTASQEIKKKDDIINQLRNQGGDKSTPSEFRKYQRTNDSRNDPERVYQPNSSDCESRERLFHMKGSDYESKERLINRKRVHNPSYQSKSRVIESPRQNVENVKNSSSVFRSEEDVLSKLRHPSRAENDIIRQSDSRRNEKHIHKSSLDSVNSENSYRLEHVSPRLQRNSRVSPPNIIDEKPRDLRSLLKRKRGNNDNTVLPSKLNISKNDRYSKTSTGSIDKDKHSKLDRDNVNTSIYDKYEARAKARRIDTESSRNLESPNFKPTDSMRINKIRDSSNKSLQHPPNENVSCMKSSPTCQNKSLDNTKAKQLKYADIFKKTDICNSKPDKNRVSNDTKMCSKNQTLSFSNQEKEQHGKDRNKINKNVSEKEDITVDVVKVKSVSLRDKNTIPKNLTTLQKDGNTISSISKSLNRLQQNKNGNNDNDLGEISQSDNLVFASLSDISSIESSPKKDHVQTSKISEKSKTPQTEKQIEDKTHEKTDDSLNKNGSQSSRKGSDDLVLINKENETEKRPMLGELDKTEKRIGSTSKSTNATVTDRQSGTKDVTQVKMKNCRLTSEKSCSRAVENDEETLTFRQESKKINYNPKENTQTKQINNRINQESNKNHALEKDDKKLKFHKMDDNLHFKEIPSRNLNTKNTIDEIKIINGGNKITKQGEIIDSRVVSETNLKESNISEERINSKTVNKNKEKINIHTTKNTNQSIQVNEKNCSNKLSNDTSFINVTKIDVEEISVDKNVKIVDKVLSQEPSRQIKEDLNSFQNIKNIPNQDNLGIVGKLPNCLDDDKKIKSISYENGDIDSDVDVDIVANTPELKAVHVEIDEECVSGPGSGESTSSSSSNSSTSSSSSADSSHSSSSSRQNVISNHTVSRFPAACVEDSYQESNNTSNTSIPFKHLKPKIEAPANSCSFEMSHQTSSTVCSETDKPINKITQRAFPISPLTRNKKQDTSLNSVVSKEQIFELKRNKPPNTETGSFECTEKEFKTSDIETNKATTESLERFSTSNMSNETKENRSSSNDTLSPTQKTPVKLKSHLQQEITPVKSKSLEFESPIPNNFIFKTPTKTPLRPTRGPILTKTTPVKPTSHIFCTSNLIVLGDEESCSNFPSPAKNSSSLPSEFYPPGVRGIVAQEVTHHRHIRGTPKVVHEFVTGEDPRTPELIHKVSPMVEFDERFDEYCRARSERLSQSDVETVLDRQEDHETEDVDVDGDREDLSDSGCSQSDPSCDGYNESYTDSSKESIETEDEVSDNENQLNQQHIDTKSTPSFFNKDTVFTKFKSTFKLEFQDFQNYKPHAVFCYGSGRKLENKNFYANKLRKKYSRLNQQRKIKFNLQKRDKKEVDIYKLEQNKDVQNKVVVDIKKGKTSNVCSFSFNSWSNKSSRKETIVDEKDEIVDEIISSLDCSWKDAIEQDFNSQTHAQPEDENRHSVSKSKSPIKDNEIYDLAEKNSVSKYNIGFQASKRKGLSDSSNSTSASVKDKPVYSTVAQTNTTNCDLENTSIIQDMPQNEINRHEEHVVSHYTNKNRRNDQKNKSPSEIEYSNIVTYSSFGSDEKTTPLKSTHSARKNRLTSNSPFKQSSSFVYVDEISLAENSLSAFDADLQKDNSDIQSSYSENNIEISNSHDSEIEADTLKIASNSKIKKKSYQNGHKGSLEAVKHFDNSDALEDDILKVAHGSKPKRKLPQGKCEKIFNVKSFSDSQISEIVVDNVKTAINCKEKGKSTQERDKDVFDVIRFVSLAELQAKRLVTTRFSLRTRKIKEKTNSDSQKSDSNCPETFFQSDKNGDRIEFFRNVSKIKKKLNLDWVLPNLGSPKPIMVSTFGQKSPCAYIEDKSTPEKSTELLSPKPVRKTKSRVVQKTLESEFISKSANKKPVKKSPNNKVKASEVQNMLELDITAEESLNSSNQSSSKNGAKIVDNEEIEEGEITDDSENETEPRKSSARNLDKKNNKIQTSSKFQAVNFSPLNLIHRNSGVKKGYGDWKSNWLISDDEYTKEVRNPPKSLNSRTSTENRHGSRLLQNRRKGLENCKRKTVETWNMKDSIRRLSIKRNEHNFDESDTRADIKSNNGCKIENKNPESIKQRLGTNRKSYSSRFDRLGGRSRRIDDSYIDKRRSFELNRRESRRDRNDFNNRDRKRKLSPTRNNRYTDRSRSSREITKSANCWNSLNHELDGLNSKRKRVDEKTITLDLDHNQSNELVKNTEHKIENSNVNDLDLVDDIKEKDAFEQNEIIQDVIKDDEKQTHSVEADQFVLSTEELDYEDFDV